MNKERKKEKTHPSTRCNPKEPQGTKRSDGWKDLKVLAWPPEVLGNGIVQQQGHPEAWNWQKIQRTLRASQIRPLLKDKSHRNAAGHSVEAGRKGKKKLAHSKKNRKKMNRRKKMNFTWKWQRECQQLRRRHLGWSAWGWGALLRMRGAQCQGTRSPNWSTYFQEFSQKKKKKKKNN